MFNLKKKTTTENGYSIVSELLVAHLFYNFYLACTVCRAENTITGYPAAGQDPPFPQVGLEYDAKLQPVLEL